MERRRKNLLIFGHYGLPNWGDEAILAGLLRRLNPQKWNIQVISPFSEFLKREHGIKSVPPPPAGLRSLFHTLLRGKFRKSLQPIRQADYVIFGGGGLFQEYPKKALRIWNWYLRLCHFFNKKILLVGNSVGPFRSGRSCRKTARLFQTVSFFSVRDSSSAETLLRMGIPEQKIHLASDAAFLLPPLQPSRTRKQLILLSLRAEDIAEEDLKIWREYIESWRKIGKNFEFLCMQKHQSRDAELAAKLELPLFFPRNLPDLRQKIAQSTLLISGRLHPALLAMLSGTPFLALPVRPKIADFLRGAGLEELLITPFSLDELKKRTEVLLKNKKIVQNRIQATGKKEKKKTAFLFPDFI